MKTAQKLQCPNRWHTCRFVSISTPMCAFVCQCFLQLSCIQEEFSVPPEDLSIWSLYRVWSWLCSRSFHISRVQSPESFSVSSRVFVQQFYTTDIILILFNLFLFFSSMSLNGLVTVFGSYYLYLLLFSSCQSTAPKPLLDTSTDSYTGRQRSQFFSTGASMSIVMSFV